jgi:exonuclease VII small subunit
MAAQQTTHFVLASFCIPSELRRIIVDEYLYSTNITQRNQLFNRYMIEHSTEEVSLQHQIYYQLFVDPANTQPLQVSSGENQAISEYGKLLFGPFFLTEVDDISFFQYNHRIDDGKSSSPKNNRIQVISFAMESVSLLRARRVIWEYLLDHYTLEALLRQQDLETGDTILEWLHKYWPPGTKQYKHLYEVFDRAGRKVQDATTRNKKLVVRSDHSQEPIPLYTWLAPAPVKYAAFSVIDSSGFVVDVSKTRESGVPKELKTFTYI